MASSQDPQDPTDQEVETSGDEFDYGLITHKPSDEGEWWLSQTPRLLGNGRG